MELTYQQYQAVTKLNKNLVVIAGAGSGKTAVLVQRFLTLLEHHADWPLNAIVAITFTEKAAAEMRDRIREGLSERLDKASTQESIVRWSKLLSAMESARIGTIHALCTTILRANAAKAGIDPAFEVLDEVGTRLLLDNVLADVLQSLVATGDETLALFDEYDFLQIQEVLTNENLLNTELAPLPHNLMEHWQALWESLLDHEIYRLIQNTQFIDALNWSPPRGWSSVAPDDRLLAVWQEIKHYGQLLFQTTNTREQFKIANKLTESINLKLGGHIAWGGKEYLAEAKEVLKFVRDTIQNTETLIGEPPGPVDQRASELVPLWHSLIESVQQAYRNAKRSAGQLDFNDLEHLTVRLLHDTDVQSRYRGKEFRHLMVDEFQDTNAAQWSIIKSLSDLQSGGTLFVVGDPKQSIYEFRGADVSVFGSVQDEILQTGGERIPLNRSFRTHRHLIDGLNNIFMQLLVRDENSPVKDYQVIYEEMSAERQEAPAEISTALLLLENTDYDDTGAIRLTANNRVKYLNTGIIRAWEAYEIAGHLHNMVNSQMPVFDKKTQQLRPMQYNDIAILFQSLREVKRYEDVFKLEGLPYMTVAGYGYFNRQEIWDLHNLLKALQNPADNLSLAAALRSPLFNFSDNMLLALRLVKNPVGKRAALWDALTLARDGQVAYLHEEDLPRIAFANHCLTKLRAMAGRVTISELLREALDKTGYLAVLTALPDGHRRRGNVEKLVALAEESGKVTLGAFSHYLEDLTISEVREGEVTLDSSGAVTLMTVHASKGLEFPVIVLADTSRKVARTPKNMVMLDQTYGLACRLNNEIPEDEEEPPRNKDKTPKPFTYRQITAQRKSREEAESYRKLYVAATRAQDYLIVSGLFSRRTNGEVNAQGWLKDIWDVLNITKVERAQSFAVQKVWGTVNVHVPHFVPEATIYARSHIQNETLWDRDDVQRGEPIKDIDPLQPPLLEKFVVQRDTSLRHLAAIQIADLGGAKHGANIDEREFFRQQFRRKLFEDAPSHIKEIVPQRQPRVAARKIGEIVHEALRYGHYDTHSQSLHDILRSYAWQQGVTHNADLDYAVNEAAKLLEHFQKSDVYQWIQNAAAIYPELPFIYKTDKRIIHGVMDLLLQHPDGTWVIIDYKTGYVPKDLPIEEHARRYHLQVGVYAAAVQEHFEHLVVPNVFIHYIRHTKTVEIPTTVWQAELEYLEMFIGDLVRDTE